MNYIEEDDMQELIEENTRLRKELRRRCGFKNTCDACAEDCPLASKPLEGK